MECEIIISECGIISFCIITKYSPEVHPDLGEVLLEKGNECYSIIAQNNLFLLFVVLIEYPKSFCLEPREL